MQRFLFWNSLHWINGSIWISDSVSRRVGYELKICQDPTYYKIILSSRYLTQILFSSTTYASCMSCVRRHIGLSCRTAADELWTLTLAYSHTLMSMYMLDHDVDHCFLDNVLIFNMHCTSVKWCRASLLVSVLFPLIVTILACNQRTTVK